MKVSVIVPFLNEREHIGKCIEALLAQEIPNQIPELIFIDNGSTDGSSELVGEYEQIQLVQEKVRDPYLARNRGIAAAQGDLIVMTDADCVPENSRWLATLVSAAEQERADIVLGDIRYPDDASLLLRCYEDYYNTKTAYLLEKGDRRYLYGHGGNMAIRMSVFRRVGVFEPMPIVGDTEIIHRLLGAFPQSRVSHRPAAKVIHREVTTFRACLHKLFESGRYSANYRAVSDYRTLEPEMKLHVLKTCIKESNYSPGKSLALLWALATGLLAFQWGLLSVRNPGR